MSRTYRAYREANIKIFKGQDRPGRPAKTRASSRIANHTEHSVYQKPSKEFAQFGNPDLTTLELEEKAQNLINQNKMKVY